MGVQKWINASTLLGWLWRGNDHLSFTYYVSILSHLLLEILYMLGLMVPTWQMDKLETWKVNWFTQSWSWKVVKLNPLQIQGRKWLNVKEKYTYNTMAAQRMEWILWPGQVREDLMGEVEFQLDLDWQVRDDGKRPHIRNKEYQKQRHKGRNEY